ncbi:tol-pal system protein YbgF, partial [candidate division KSB3 bacterium]
MKKMTVCSILAVACCFMLPISGFAQYQISPAQPPAYYQPYSPQSIQPVPSYVPYPPYPSYSCQPSYQDGYWTSPQCMYQYGLQLVRSRRYYEAIRVFDEFLRSYPQSSLADNALYWSGECYYAMKQYSTALAYFQQIQYYYPRGNKMPDSLLKTALCYFSMNQNSQGCQMLNELRYRYP